METLQKLTVRSGCEAELDHGQVVEGIAEIARAGAEIQQQRQQADQATVIVYGGVPTLHSVEIEPIKHEEK